MLRSLHSAATGMKAQQTFIDVTSNNLANVNTTGFKRSRVNFQDLMYQTQEAPGADAAQGVRKPTGIQVGNGVRTASVQKEFGDGAVRVTNNPTDVRVVGQGFFRIQLPGGQGFAYTRDGAFQRNEQGQLVTSGGYLLDPPITIGTDAVSVSIAEDGVVSTQLSNGQNVNAGTIQIASFVNPGGLKALGGNLFQETPASGNAQQGTPGTPGFGQLQSGALEMSNVTAVEEMISLITAQRAFEFNSKSVQASDQMLRELSNLR